MTAAERLAEAVEFRDLFRTAYRAVALGQEYEIGSRKLKRADAQWLREQFEYWDAQVDGLTAGAPAGVPVFRFMPVDC